MESRDPLTVEWTTWDDSERTEITSWEEAEIFLNRLATRLQLPCLIEFYAARTGQSFGLGVGREETVATYQDSLDPPYFISLGDAGRSGIEWFCYGNERTEYLAINLIHINLGKAALKEFIESRIRPNIISWEAL